MCIRDSRKHCAATSVAGFSEGRVIVKQLPHSKIITIVSIMILIIKDVYKRQAVTRAVVQWCTLPPDSGVVTVEEVFNAEAE